MAADRNPLERLLAPDEDVNTPLSRTSAQRRRSLEAYLQAGGPPRWMERLGEIDAATRRHRAALGRAYDRLRDECAGDDAEFARRWREVAEAWPFEQVNRVIAQHNDWYPIERRLAVNPRTGDYVLIHGRSYRRRELDADWVLEQLPAGGG